MVKKRMKAFFVLLALVGILFISAAAQTRETGSIQGRILDEEGNPLPGATVVISSPNLMGVRSTTTDSEGRYRFAALPGGIYTVEVSLSGFNTVKKTGIQLHIGMTLLVDVTLTPAKVAEEVTVIGTAPIIDVKSATLNRTVISTDLLENIPTPRNAYEILNLAPGVVNMYAYGGGATATTFQLDGVELDDAWCGSGVYATPIDYYVVEEAQVIALGASAEYGNFTGALINLVTKSGGNKTSGDVLISYQGKKWKSENIKANDPRWSLLPESLDREELDLSFHLGGAILADKIWYFAGVEYLYQDSYMRSIDRSQQLKFPKTFLKLTFQPTDKTRLQAFFQYHNRQRFGTLSKFYAEEAQNDLLYPVYVGNISLVHIISSSAIFEFKAAGYTIRWDSIPHSRDKSTPGHYDLVTGMYTHNQYWWSIWKSRRYGLSSNLSLYKEDFISGSHEIKIGAEIERSEGGGDVSLNGGVLYYDRNGAPYQAITYSMNEWATHNRFTFYFQDDWKIIDPLVLNPGVRFNIYRGAVPGIGTVYKPINFEPRIGFTWDIFRNQKTVFKAHFGRYNEDTKTYYMSRAKQSMSDRIYYSVPQWGTLVELYRIPAVNQYSVDPKIRHPYAYQITAGIEQVLGKDLMASVAVFYKNWNDIIAPVNIKGIWEPVSYPDPDTGQTFIVYNQVNPGADHYYITNPQKGKDIGAAYPEIVSRTPEKIHKAIEFRLTKRYSNNWMLTASYVYSMQEGTFTDSYGREETFFNPNNQINFYGSYATDIPHVFKLQGSFTLPFDISIGFYYIYNTGLPWTRTFRVYGMNQGAFTILAEKVGSRRLPNNSNLDVRIEKPIYFAGAKFRFMVDVFNVFNRGVETAVYTLAGSNFGKPTSATTPRTIRASLRVIF